MTKKLVLTILFLVPFGPHSCLRQEDVGAAPVSAPTSRGMGVKVVVNLDVNDVNDSPRLVEWGKTAKVLIEEWHHRIANLIPTKGFEVPTEVSLKIRKSSRGIGGTSGGRITVSSGWIEKHPDDIGLVFHELVHVIQDYKGSGSGWVTEGIADYLRWAIYEGKDQNWFPVSEKPQGYKDSYQVAGGFFLWLETDACPGIVNKLNTAIRRGTYKDETFFKEVSGHTIDSLWADYIKDRKKPELGQVETKQDEKN